MPIELLLTRGICSLIDEDDSDLQLMIWYPNFTKSGKIYAYNRRAGGFIHRIILSRVLNRKLDQKEQVDHINLNGLDNRRQNLRLANRQNNSRNTSIRSDSSTNLKGVSKCQYYWRASITVDSRSIYLGTYDTEQDAGIAYNIAAKKLFGEFARFNNIPNWENILPVKRSMQKRQRITNTSGFPNVYQLKSGNWQAKIRIDGKMLTLGTKPTAKEAYELYLISCKKYKIVPTPPSVHEE